MSDRPTPRTDAVAVKNIYGVQSEVDVDFAKKLEIELDDALRERDEARAFIEELVDLVAYGLGQHASIWSQTAMTKARDAIAKAKSWEGAK